MVGRKTALVTHINGSREVIGTAEVDTFAGDKSDVDIENVGPNVISYEVNSAKLNLPDEF